MTDLFDERFPADLSRLEELRRVLREHLERLGVDEAQVDRMVLVVDEVVSNAIEHGSVYRRSPNPIRVCVERFEAFLLLKVDDADVPSDLVTNLARVFDDQIESVPSAVVERGRGMFLITMFLEGLEILSAEGGGMRLQGRLDASAG